MPRFAIGDLLVDLDLPACLQCRYENSGALLASDTSDRFAIRFSGITVQAKDPMARNLCVSSVSERATSNGATLERIKDDLVFCRQKSAGDWGGEAGVNDFCFVGFGNREIVVTLSYAEADRDLNTEELRTVVDSAIRSIRLVYPDTPRHKDQIEVFDLAESQRPWLEQHRAILRRRVQQLTGYDADGLVPLPVLDDYWSHFIAAPPADNDELNLILNSVGVALGDHLVRVRSFEWVIISDNYGVCIGVVALRGTANVTTDPFNFVAKRWERKEPRFLLAGVQALADTVDKFAKDWAVNSEEKTPSWAFWKKRRG